MFHLCNDNLNTIKKLHNYTIGDCFQAYNSLFKTTVENKQPQHKNNINK